MLAAVIALCPISSHHHVTVRDAAVLLSALSQSITISVLAFDSSEPQRAASSTLPPTDPLPLPPSPFPSQHVILVAPEDMVGMTLSEPDGGGGGRVGGGVTGSLSSPVLSLFTPLWSL